MLLDTQTTLEDKMKDIMLEELIAYIIGYKNLPVIELELSVSPNF